jgi:Fur family ferric uptake transcriptional regulator
MEKPRRNTRQRKVILEELRRLEVHPTASELHAVVQRRLPRVSLGTVYRNLELLVQQGLVRKLVGHGERARFDGDPDRHLHVRCLACGHIGDVPGVVAELTGEWPESAGGFEILGLRAELTGLCAECKKRLPPEEVARLRGREA